MDRTIFHIDINSCYASIECLYRPELRDKPVAVSGDAEARHGIILAKNEHAKKFGVKTGEAIWQAKQKCPQLITVPPRFELYLRFSRMAREIFCQYSDRVEPFGIDEAWVDVTGSTGKNGASLADHIRRQIKTELGVTVSVGVSFNKIFAKLGSDYKKPDAVTVFSRENFRSRVWPLPASDLLYVGPATTRKLRDYNIATIGGIAQAPVELLEQRLGKWGLILHSFANGRDSSPVALAGEVNAVKSIGNSTTTPRDLTCEQDAKIIFYMLCESVAERLREQGLKATTVQIGLRDSSLYSFERQTSLYTPTCLASELHRAAMSLLRENYDWKKPLRSIGVTASGLVPASSPDQISLFESPEQREKHERLERAVDNIRRRFGHYSIGRAVTTIDSTLTNINPKDDHVIHPVGYFKNI
ncbi:MAG: DNA polymerase IV [Oscillospiraceae bacterium]